MLQAGDAVLVGVSGGPDSVALLHVILKLADRFSLRIGVAHLNHCLRRQCSDQDAAFVAGMAEELALPCFIGRKDVRKYQRENRLSLEEAGRRIRYAFLESIADRNGYTKIALGHHADDNAELILMYMLRGSGLLGLSGIPAVRDEMFIRPLIRTQRAQIMTFLSANRLPYVCDASNDDLQFTRNRIRHQLLPVLKQDYNPNIVDALNRLGDVAGTEEEWLQEIVAPLFEQCLLAQEKGTLVLSAEKIRQLHPAAGRRIIRRAIRQMKGDLRRITLYHVDSIIRLINKDAADRSFDFPGRIRIEFQNDMLRFRKEKQPLRTIGGGKKQDHTISFSYAVSRPAAQPVFCFIKETDATLKFSQVDLSRVSEIGRTGQQFAFFDMNKLCFPLLVRNFRPGDRFMPLGMKGRQKVKDFFINCKVPVRQRKVCPILLSRNEIIWVAGYRMDETVKITASTRKVLKVELLLA